MQLTGRGGVHGSSGRDMAAATATSDDGDRLPSLSVVVPVYRGAATLADLCSRLGAVLPKISSEYELIFVNDASPDDSWSIIGDLARAHSWVRGIQLMRNSGQHNALLCGIRQARFELVATLDDDLQHPPEALPGLLRKLGEGYDVVYGTPDRMHHGLLRNAASQFTKFAFRSAMGVESARGVSALRVFRSSVRRAFANYTGAFVSIDVLLTWGTTRFAAISVRHDPRRYGSSNYTFRKLLTHGLNMMTGFSTLPLQLASWIGFTFTVFGMALLAYVLGRYLLEGSTVPGFPFLASMIAIFAGAQLFALGIIGEYLARMHFRLLERPPYTIAATTGPTPGDTAAVEGLRVGAQPRRAQNDVSVSDLA